MSQLFDLFHQPPMAVAEKKRDAVLLRVQQKAGTEFSRAARSFILSYLSGQDGRRAPGEDITDACKAAGIKPEKDDRAFGPVYMALAREGVIVKDGMIKRRKGHATAGGNIWRLK